MPNTVQPHCCLGFAARVCSAWWPPKLKYICMMTREWRVKSVMPSLQRMQCVAGYCGRASEIARGADVNHWHGWMCSAVLFWRGDEVTDASPTCLWEALHVLTGLLCSLASRQRETSCRLSVLASPGASAPCFLLLVMHASPDVACVCACFGSLCLCGLLLCRDPKCWCHAVSGLDAAGDGRRRAQRVVRFWPQAVLQWPIHAASEHSMQSTVQIARLQVTATACLMHPAT